MRLYEVYTDSSNGTYGVFHLSKKYVEENIDHKLTDEEFETLLYEYETEGDHGMLIETLKAYHDILVDSDEITPKPIRY